MKKYKFTGEVKVVFGITLHRIRAAVSFGAVVKGELGGWIEKEENLSQNGNAWVYGDAEVHGDAVVCGNAEVCGNADYIVFKNWWSSGRYFTWTRSNNKWRVGCFFGTGAELIAKAYKDSEKSGREYERVVKYVESILNEQ
jgi:hypothetical protein